MKITDAILTLPRRIEPISGQNFSYVKLDDVLAILEQGTPAALAVEQDVSTAEPVSVTVKPLEWNEYEHEGDIDQWDAETPFGTYYSIECRAFCFRLEHDMEMLSEWQSPGEAKQAAQDDCKHRLLAALSHVQAPAEMRLSDSVVEGIYLDLCVGVIDRERVRQSLEDHFEAASRDDVIWECINVATQVCIDDEDYGRAYEIEAALRALIEEPKP